MMATVVLHCLTVISCVIAVAAAHHFELGPVKTPKPCPGQYCGRVQFENSTYSACGPCARGFRRKESSSLCIPCSEAPTPYDWLYLGFMLIISLVMHWFSIDLVAKRRCLNWKIVVIHSCAVLEGIVAALFTLLIISPAGSLRVHACGVKALSDWYTLLHNPSPDYGDTLHCTQEAVYPLFTMVFLYYFLTLIFMFLIRPLVCFKVMPEIYRGSMYAAMYFIPGLAFLQAVLAGLLYYSFPYLIIIFSVISTATHFAYRLKQTTKDLIITTITNARNLLILFGHWVLLGYGLLALISSHSLPTYYYYVVAPLLPCPALFYVLTVRYTDPEKHHSE